MEVLLLILKIVGICLLVLFGIFLFLILSVIFIPVRYRIRGKGEFPKSFEAEMGFSWLFHIICGSVWYREEGTGFRVRIFGIPLRFGPKKPEKQKKKNPRREKKSGKGKTAEEQEPVEKSEPINEPDAMKEPELVNEPEPAKEPESIKETNAGKESDTIVTTEDSGKAESSSENKKKNILLEKINKIKRKLKHLKEQLIRLKEQLGNIKIILSEETNRNAVAALFQEFKYLMKHYSPRKASGELQFGTEDPANTGQILGVISMFPFWYRYKISVTPDFAAESLYVKGEIFMKGHMRSVHLLTSGIRLIKNKDIRKLINQIRK